MLGIIVVHVVMYSIVILKGVILRVVLLCWGASWDTTSILLFVYTYSETILYTETVKGAFLLAFTDVNTKFTNLLQCNFTNLLKTN
jgi:hypothetical protein